MRLQVPLVVPNTQCSRCGQVVDENLQHPMRCVKVGRNSVHHPISKFISGHLTDTLRHTASAVHYEMNMSHMTTQACDKINPLVDVAIRNPITQSNVIIDFTFPIISAEAMEDKSTVCSASGGTQGQLV